MKIRSPWWLTVLCFLAIPAVASAEKTPAVGDLLGALRLPTPESAEPRASLGLSPGDTFPLTAIAGKPWVIDEDFTVHKAIGEVRTPFFIVAALGSAGIRMILWTRSGNSTRSRG